MLTLTESKKVVKLRQPSALFRAGYEDGKAGQDCSFLYAGGHGEHEYKEGLAAGRIMAARLASDADEAEQPAFVPAQHRMIFYAGGTPPEQAPYVPFQGDASDYADVLPAEDREDYVGM